MRILLTGKNGQVGFELQRALAPLCEIVAVDRKDCDLANPAAIRRLVGVVAPQIIVNPAAYTSVDGAESEFELAQAINSIAPGVFGQEAARLGALVVHYSTDYVFDGTKDGGYLESDIPNPQSVYGKTKLAGERALTQSGAEFLIFRTSWVFGAHGDNFAKAILRLAAERSELKVVADQFGSPTSAALLADSTAQVIGRYLREGRAGFPFGLYHLVAGGVTTWHEYALVVLRAALARGKALNLGLESVLPIYSADHPQLVRRPANSRLDTNRLRAIFGLCLPDWRSGLDHVLQQIL